MSAIPGGYNYSNSNWGDSDVVRAAVAFAPTASLKITPSLYYQHLYSHDSSGFEPAESGQSQDAFVQQWGTLNPQYSNFGRGRFVNPQLEQTPSTDTFYLPALKAQTRSGCRGYRLISNTGYLHRSDTTNEDFTTATPVASQTVMADWSPAHYRPISYIIQTYHKTSLPRICGSSPPTPRINRWCGR